MNFLNTYTKQIQELCIANNVNSLFAFGSATTGKFNMDSDIDLIVDIIDKDPISYSTNYFNLKEQLEQLLKRKIDLLEQKAINNPIFKEKIDQSKVLLYGK